MRRRTSRLPYIPVLLVLGWLGTRFRVVLGLFLIAHGLVHVLYVVPKPERSPGGTEWPFHLDRSWALSDVGLGEGALRATGIVLMVLTIGAFLLSVAVLKWPALSYAGA